MLPPSNVSPPAFVTTLAAATLPKVVRPVLFTVRAPSAPLVASLPTAPPNVTAPVPVLTVRLRAVVSALSTVLANFTALFVVVRVALVSRVTASL